MSPAPAIIATTIRKGDRMNRTRPDAIATTTPTTGRQATPPHPHRHRTDRRGDRLTIHNTHTTTHRTSGVYLRVLVVSNLSRARYSD
jgi:hypothetical protein